MNQVKAEIISNERVAPGMERVHGRSICGVFLMQLRAPEIVRSALPGQFVMVRCGEGMLPRPFSIHRVDGDVIKILYAGWEEGAGSTWLAQRRRGEAVSLFGSLGNGYSVTPGANHLLLVAGGIGIAPLCFLADEAVKAGKVVRLLMGAGTAGQLLSREIAPEGVDLFCCTEDGTEGEAGLVTDLLGGHAEWADQVLACGPLPMYRSMVENRRAWHLEGKPVQVSLETRMACGIGVCYGCTVNTKQGLKQVCKDGPVFDLEDIVWDALARV